jgi:hypothetical protein
MHYLLMEFQLLEKKLFRPCNIREPPTFVTENHHGSERRKLTIPKMTKSSGYPSLNLAFINLGIRCSINYLGL